MTNTLLPRRWSRRIEQAGLNTDAARALRSSVAFMVPLVLMPYLGHPEMGIFVATTAQNVALTDVRGDYSLRFAVLLTMTLVMAGAAFLGTWSASHLLAAILAMGAIALLGGVWRHLSGDYGPRLGVVSGLLFLIGLSLPKDLPDALRLAGVAALGGLGGIVLQMVEWFFHPQHALRHAVAEDWVAVSDLFTAMRTQTNDGQSPAGSAFSTRESELRATLDQTAGLLSTANTRRKSALLSHLEEARYAAARLATRVSALNTGVEAIRSRPDARRIEPVIDSTLRALANTARSVALTLINHRPEQLVALDARLRRCSHLLRILEERLDALAPNDIEIVQARQLLDQVGVVFPEIRAIVAETVDHGAVHSAFPLHLPELGELSHRDLAAWINPAPQLDSVLVRYSLRMAVVTMIAVAIYEYFNIHHGYWIAFTAIVVLQPDYGSTREKAGQRITGTLAGSLLASVVLWIRLPVLLLQILAAVTAFLFAFFVKRRYGLAVFFVTLMLVLAIESTTPLQLDFTRDRLLSNLAGGVTALLAALLFWPHWERERSPKIIADAVRANRAYLDAISGCLAKGESFTGEAIHAKRKSERANSLASASLQRMLGEPASHHENVEQATALTAYNQRITRALTVLALQLNQQIKLDDPDTRAAFAHCGESLENLAQAVEKDGPAPSLASVRADLAALGSRLPTRRTDGKPTPADLVHGQLVRVATEIDAMGLALSQTNPSVEGP